MPTRRARRERPTLVFFVRHGLTATTGRVLPGRAPGLHLAPEGVAQAEAVAERLAAVPRVDAVYSSPLARARETAAPLARRLGQRVKVDRGLQECDFGNWTGEELKALMKLPEWRTVQRWPSGFRFPDGESFSDMQARMIDTVARLRHLHAGGTIVVVSHADPIKAVVADALGAHLDHFQRIVISPCSITTVSYSSGGPTVLNVNSVPEPAKVKAS